MKINGFNKIIDSRYYHFFFHFLSLLISFRFFYKKFKYKQTRKQKTLYKMHFFVNCQTCFVFRIASKKMYSWQTNSNFYFPGNYVSVAKQFLRCVFSQLVRNEIFYQLFQCEFESMITKKLKRV